MSGQRYAIEDVMKMEKRIRELEGERDDLKMRLSVCSPDMVRPEGYHSWHDKCTLQEEEITRLRKCLKRLEWCDFDGTLHDCCPACEGYREGAGHASDCWLAAAIREGE